MENSPTPTLLNKTSAADYLQISKRTLDTWISSQKIPFIKLGEAKNSAVRFRKLDLDTFVEKHLINGTKG